ncbi:MAG TPA: hypothetical protein VHS09_15610 [Polyangiaceae bacterium]|jgi:hypothetical protein|nr:hypothetical protein [Polyangiaceae bacterium]
MAGPDRSPEAYLASRVSELDGHWLEIDCACGSRAYYPCRLLAKTCGAKRVDELHGRFRCQQCGGRPVRVGITNSPARGVMYADVWTLPLVDAGAA